MRRRRHYLLWLLYMRTGAGSCNCKHVKMSIESNRSRDKTMVKKYHYLDEKCLINSWFFTHTNLPALLPRSWSMSYYIFFLLEISSFQLYNKISSYIEALLAYNPAKISKYISPSETRLLRINTILRLMKLRLISRKK